MPVVPVVTPDGDRIREVREKLGLSRAEVAAKMARHRHPKTIDRIERGADPVASKVFMQELADALGTDIGALIKAGEAA